MESYLHTMSYSIFYSWQSDLPNPLNRGFIEGALEKAAKKIKRENNINVIIDSATEGVAGSPKIDETIFRKIREADVFVCDVSIINKAGDFRLTPNPNILVELGYAIKALGSTPTGSTRYIMVINTAFGRIEDLPFDLKMYKCLTYSLPQEDKDDPEKTRKCRDELVGQLIKAIKSIVWQFEPQSLRNELKLLDKKVNKSRQKFVIAVRCAIEKVETKLVLPSFVDQFQAIEDEFDEFFVFSDGQSHFWHVSDKNKLIEYAKKIAALLNSCVTKPEIKGRLLDTVNYDDLLPSQKIEIASVVTPFIKQESPDLMDIYFRILEILDKRTSSWKRTFESQLPDFEDDSVTDQIYARQNYIEEIDALRLEILKWSLPKENVTT